jgi:hypothetical protein
LLGPGGLIEALVKNPSPISVLVHRADAMHLVFVDGQFRPHADMRIP